MLEFGNETALTLTHAPFLRRIEEVEDNCVRFIVSLTTQGTQSEEALPEDARLQQILSHAHPLCPDETQTYEITFTDYILYQTRNESYCSYDPQEVRRGRYFLIFEHSRLLDTLPLLTDCQMTQSGDAYPGRWTHYGIYCQNHIIDIISHTAPVIRNIGL